MSGWIKYFKNGGKSRKYVYVKYKNIWKKIKDLLSGIRLNSDVIYNDQYVKTKVKTFEMVKTLFDNDKIPEEMVECERIPCTSVDSILKIEKKWFPQVYLEPCKYRVKVKERKSLVDYDLDSDYESD